MSLIDSLPRNGQGGLAPRPTTRKTGGLVASLPANGGTSRSTPSITSAIPTKKDFQEISYFYGKDAAGNAIGASDELDVSGKRLLGIKYAGNAATTTDRTRVATSFDPRKPQKLERKNLTNGRIPLAASQAIRAELGASYDEQLDHSISLQLSGSNDRSNLKLVKTVDGKQPLVGLENELGRKVIKGEISLFDAQVALAKAKGLPVPFTGKDIDWGALNMKRPDAFQYNPILTRAHTGNALSTLKEVGQSIARNIGSAGLTVAGAVQSLTEQKTPGAVVAGPLGSKDFESYFGQALFETVFGEGEELKPIETRIAEAEPKIKAWQEEVRGLSETPGLNPVERTVTHILANLRGPTLAFAGIMGSVGLDLTPFGGLEKNLAKKLIEETTEEGARALLRGMGVADDVAQEMAPRIPGLSNPEDAKAFIMDLGNAQAEFLQSQKAAGSSNQERLPISPRAEETFDEMLTKISDLNGDQTLIYADSIARKSGSETIEPQHIMEAAQYRPASIAEMNRVRTEALAGKGGIETYKRAEQVGVDGLDPEFAPLFEQTQTRMKEMDKNAQELFVRWADMKYGDTLGTAELQEINKVLDIAERLKIMAGEAKILNQHVLEAMHYGPDMTSYLQKANAPQIARVKEIFGGKLPGQTGIDDAVKMHDEVVRKIAEIPKEHRAALAPHIQAAPAAKKYADTIAQSIATKLGNVYHATGIKGIPRIVEKGVADYGGDFSKIKDYVRGTITVDDVDGGAKALKEFQATDHPVGEAKMHLEKPMDNGFRTIMQNGRAPNGQVFEMQFTTPELLEAKKKFGDALYNQSRSIEAKALAAGRKLTKKEEAQIAFINTKMRNLYARAYAAGKRRLASAKVKGDPSLNARAKDPLPADRSKGSQEPPAKSREGTPADLNSKSTPSFSTKRGEEAIDPTIPQEGAGGKPPTNAEVGIASGAPEGSPEMIEKKIVANKFNLEKLNLTPEEEADVVARMDAMGLFGHEVKTFADIQKAAEVLGTNPAALLRDVKSGRLTAEEAKALGNLINQNAQRLADVEKQLITDPTNKELLTARDIAESQMNTALKKLVEGSTEIGRSLGILRALASRSMEPAVWYRKAVRELDGKEFTDEMRRAINDLIEKKDQHGLATFVSMLRTPTFAEQAVTLWKAGLLTSPTTHLANIGGNSTMSALMTASDVVAFPLDVMASMITGKRTVTTGTRAVAAKIRGAVTGAKKAAEFAKTGIYDSDLLSKYDLPQTPMFKNKILKGYTDAVFRSLGAEDIFFRQSALSESMEKQAQVMAKNEGLTGADAKARVKYLLENPTNEMSVQAIDDAEYATFTSDNALAEFISAGKNTVKGKGVAGQGIYAITEAIAPFVKTPLNVTARVADFSPLGFIKALVRFSNPVTRSQKNLVKDLSRAITGTGIMAFGAYLYQKGLMTGNAPSNQKEKDQWQSEGKQPNSIYLFGKWRSLNRISPVGNLMGLGAEFERLGQENSGVGLAVATGAAGLKSLTEMNFLKGVSGTLKAVNEPERYGEILVENTAGSVIPAVVGRVAGTIDPVSRIPDGAVEAIQSRLPFLSDSLPARRDVFGNAMERPGGRFNLIDPFQSIEANQSPLFDEARRVDVLIGQPAKTIAKTPLTNKEYSAFQMVRGKMLEQQLTALVTSDQYKNAKTSQQANMFEDTIEAVNRSVQDQIFPALMIVRYNLPKDTDPVALKSILTELNMQPKFKNASTEWQGRVLSKLLESVK